MLVPMRRRHLLALVILALVVATVLAMGPVRVFDAVMTKQVTVDWPNGNLRLRYNTWRWRSAADDTPNRIVWRRSLARWYENGQKGEEWFRGRDFINRSWQEDGRLWFHASPSGEFSSALRNGEFSEQRLRSGDQFEIRGSPPWFTEEEILQSVEGVEE